MRKVPSYRRWLRQAIIAELHEREMNLHELAAELGANSAEINRELRKLARHGLICLRYNGERAPDTYETWQRAFARLPAVETRVVSVRSRGTLRFRACDGGGWASWRDSRDNYERRQLECEMA